jgi:hypothetical protein
MSSAEVFDPYREGSALSRTVPADHYRLGAAALRRHRRTARRRSKNALIRPIWAAWFFTYTLLNEITAAKSLLSPVAKGQYDNFVQER